MLKDELGYQGAVITDDLDMKAIANRYTIEETVVRCLRAGCDGFLAKPCAPPELLAEISRLLGRPHGSGSASR